MRWKNLGFPKKGTDGIAAVVLTHIVPYRAVLYRSKGMTETRGGCLISQIKQIQGRVFGRLLTESGIDEFNGAQAGK